MASKKLVVVFGATGVQGGSVIKSILGDPHAAAEFKLRGITRDTSKPAAQSLIAQGVECVPGDLNSVDSLKKALEGAYAVFAVTNYWEKGDADLELQQGKNVANVSKEVGVQHLIWSSLLNVTELSGGKYSGVHHFDSKANVEKYIRSIGVPATFVLPGFFMSNIPGMMFPNPQSPEHEYTFAMPFPPDTPIPLFDAKDDTGKFVKKALQNREKLLGKHVLEATAYYTPKQTVEEFSAVKPEAGKGAKFVQVPSDTWAASLEKAGFPKVAAQEMLQNMLFMPDFGYFGKASLDESLSILDEKPTTWKEYINKDPKWKDLH